MPSREQWANCYIRQYRNFGARVTSPTESANLNIKSYLLNGRSDIYALALTVKELLTEQQRTFKEARAAEAIRTKFRYLSRRYHGSLPLKISYKGLELINYEYLHAKAALPTTP